MPRDEFIKLIIKNDKLAVKGFFEANYPRMKSIAMRYCKNESQANEALNFSFYTIIKKIQQQKSDKLINTDNRINETEIILLCSRFIKSIVSEYYVASTVKVTNQSTKNYDLFESTDFINYNSIDEDVLIKSIQQLVPSQRLILNLHIIDNYSVDETAEILDLSVQAVKSGLEKARYYLQKNIENCYKTMKNE
jgi:RNA polymerase sigma-70 factor (ECF subfamily)